MLAIDHIVIVTDNTKQAAENFGKEHNITVIQGGEHANWGTYNYLAYFSNDSYIEWIGIFDKKIATQSENPLIKQIVNALDDNMEGPIQYALRTDRMDKYIDQFHKSTIPFTGPIPGSRKKPNGSMLEWRMLFPGDVSEQLPFLIEWGDVKNVPEDNRLINEQQIHTISAAINNFAKFKDIYQIDLQLANAKLSVSDKLAFSIK